MQLGEVHPFAEHFGDVFLSANTRRFHMNLTVSDGLFVTGLSVVTGKGSHSSPKHAYHAASASSRLRRSLNA